MHTVHVKNVWRHRPPSDARGRPRGTVLKAGGRGVFRNKETWDHDRWWTVSPVPQPRLNVTLTLRTSDTTYSRACPSVPVLWLHSGAGRGIYCAEVSANHWKGSSAAVRVCLLMIPSILWYVSTCQVMFHHTRPELTAGPTLGTCPVPGVECPADPLAWFTGTPSITALRICVIVRGGLFNELVPSESR